MRDYSELERLAEAATQGPWGYDGSYVCPARVEGGTTYVESWRSVADCAQPENTRFIAAANPSTVLSMIAERNQLKAENEALCAKVANLNVSGFADAFYTVAAELGITGARPVSPMQVFASEVLPVLRSAIQDADRYRWIRDKSEAVHQFYLSVPLWFTGVRFRAQDVDKAIDAMSKGEQV